MSAAIDIGRIFASPLARRLARENGLDLTRVEGSGPHGRIVERDVAKALADGPAPAPRKAGPGRAFTELDRYEEIPHDTMRKAIARRLTETAQTIPHYFLTADCEIDALLRLREDFNAAAPGADAGTPAWKVSVNDFVVKALALALQRVPQARATFTAEAMRRHATSDIGVAVAIEGGLVTPIVRKAEDKSVREISDELRDLAARARARKLAPHEYEGGVSAISNLGMFGVKQFTSIINPPQSTILAVGAGEPRAVVKNGALSIATVMTVTMSCDHRAVDGAVGAQLLAEFRKIIEHPAAMFA